jgi:hypothetical protein
MFSTIDVGEWSWPSFTVTILVHFKYNLGLYACNTTHTGNDPPDVPLWCFTSKLTRTHDLNCHQAVRAFPTLRSGYDFGLQCPDHLLSTNSNVHKKTQTNLGTPAPSLPFCRKTLYGPPSESELQKYRNVLFSSGSSTVTTLGYLFRWILYVRHFQLCPDPDVDKDQLGLAFDLWVTNATTNSAEINHVCRTVHDLIRYSVG